MSFSSQKTFSLSGLEKSIINYPISDEKLMSQEGVRDGVSQSSCVSCVFGQCTMVVNALIFKARGLKQLVLFPFKSAW